MPWTRLRFAPGVNKENTRYSADGTWYDANLVRFREGFPEMWGGWIKTFSMLQFAGMCRALHRFSDLSGFQWTGIGTNRRFYVASDDVNYDVTPIEDDPTLGNDPFSVVDGTNVVTVSHMDHGRLPGDVVIFSGATDTGGILAADLNTEFIIATYIDPDSYTVEAASNASSTTSGGGGSVVASYLYHAGSADQIYGGGWGAGGWGEEEWGGDPALGSASKLGIWSEDNWGEDLVANAGKGPIFYWDATNPSDRMVNILDLPSADTNAPAYSEFILVSHKDRHLLSFGGTEFGSSSVNPMAVRWCDQEDILNWDEGDTTGTAGSLPFSRGSRLIAAKATQQEIVVWSDQAMYSLRYIGAPYIYGADLITDFSDILGMKAATVFDSTVFWMGRSGFYAYTGRVEKMPCTVWDYVSSRINLAQATKTYASTNRMHDELIWFYPSTNGDEIDSYVSFDMKENAWSIGSLSRTAWLDLDTLNNPVAASSDGYVYIHEYDADDGSVDPSVPLDAYIESAPLELAAEGAYDKGDRFLFVRRILPDLTFRNYSDGSNSPSVKFVLKTMDKPGSGFDPSETDSTAIRSTVLTVEEFTDDMHVRIRGRSLTLRIEGPTKGTKWRLGTPRIDVRTDGQR